MNIKNFMQSRVFKMVLCGLGAVAVTLLIFQVGELVGYHRAKFSYQWGESYYRGFGRKSFMGGHGALGKVIKIEADSIIVADKDKSEKSILVDKETEIRKFRETVQLVDLKLGDMVVVVGSPNEEGQIEAKLLRIMPEIK